MSPLKKTQPSDASWLYHRGVERVTCLGQGIMRYHQEVERFLVLTPPVASIWEQEGVSLFPYPAEGKEAIFWIPSLINRSYILDLTEEYSILRYLQRQGITGYLLDWGAPDTRHIRFTLEDYIACAIGALEKVVLLRGAPVVVSGYCMGGIIALVIAERRPDLVERVIGIAPPYDFHHGNASGLKHHPELFGYFETLFEGEELFDPSWMQQLFYFVHPFGINEKYIGFAQMPEGTEAYEMFLAVEHWVHDGVALPVSVAKTFLLEWVRDNGLLQGALLNPEHIKVPSLSIIGRHDRIVPEASSAPLLGKLSYNDVYYADTGHVSMMVGSKAKEAVWQPLALWVKTRQ